MFEMLIIMKEVKSMLIISVFLSDSCFTTKTFARHDRPGGVGLDNVVRSPKRDRFVSNK